MLQVKSTGKEERERERTAKASTVQHRTSERKIACGLGRWHRGGAKRRQGGEPPENKPQPGVPEGSGAGGQ